MHARVVLAYAKSHQNKTIKSPKNKPVFFVYVNLHTANFSQFLTFPLMTQEKLLG